MSPLSKGLFQRAIAESEPLWDRGLHCADTVSLKDEENTGEQFAAALGCDKDKDPLPAMRAKTPVKLLKMFPATSDAEVGAAFADLLTQTEFAAFARFVCQSASVKKTNAYLYQFTRVPPTQEGALLGAFHGSEMPYVFGNLIASQGYTQVDTDLSKVIMGYRTRFAASGDPNGGGQPNWSEYGPEDQNMELGEQVQVNSGLFKQACDLADRIYVGGKP